MTKIYELMADLDCTTRSIPSSFGLFATREKAERALRELRLGKWQWGEIKERRVH